MKAMNTLTRCWKKCSIRGKRTKNCAKITISKTREASQRSLEHRLRSKMTRKIRLKNGARFLAKKTVFLKTATMEKEGAVSQTIRAGRRPIATRTKTNL